MTDLPPADLPHLIDWIDDVIYVIDAEGRLTFANTRTLNHWGKQLHDVLGLPLEMMLPYVAPEVREAFNRALITQQRTEFDTHGVRHRGWINITLHPYNGGLIVHVKPLLRTTGTPTPEHFTSFFGLNFSA